MSYVLKFIDDNLEGIVLVLLFAAGVRSMDLVIAEAEDPGPRSAKQLEREAVMLTSVEQEILRKMTGAPAPARPAAEPQSEPKAALKMNGAPAAVQAPVKNAKTPGAAPVPARKPSWSEMDEIERRGGELEQELSAALKQMEELKRELRGKEEAIRALKEEVRTLRGEGRGPQSRATGAADSLARRSFETMPLATVVEKPGDLWTDRSEGHKLLTLVGNGTQLAVEHRVDDWYRVVTARGRRGWIPARQVNFGPNQKSRPTETVKIRGYDVSHTGEGF